MVVKMVVKKHRRDLPEVDLEDRDPLSLSAAKL
jgi:hypothetical protein